MSEPTPNPEHVAKAGSFLTEQTAGVPNWVWGLTLAAGIGLAVFLPRFFGGSNSSGGTGVTPSGAGATDTGSGLGLAVDPSSGLPYAVSGLVPSGQTYTGSAPPPTSSTPTPTPTPTGSGSVPPAKQTPPPVQATYYTVPKWPNPGSTLGQIANMYGTNVSALMSLNPGISNPDLIYAGQQLRVR